MKRRFLALSLAAAIAAGTLAGCGSGNKKSASGDDDTLVVWTLAADLEDFAKHYEEETGSFSDHGAGRIGRAGLFLLETGRGACEAGGRRGG